MQMLGNSAADNDPPAKSARAAYRSLLRVSDAGEVNWGQWMMSDYDIERGDLIATGGFAKAYKGIINGHTPVAIKDDDVDRKKFTHEVKVCYSLRHSYILPLRGANQSGRLPYIVCPLMKNGTLRKCE